MTDTSQKPEVQAAGPPQVTEKRTTLLVIGTDLALAKQIQGLFQGQQGIEDPPRIFPGINFEKITECLKNDKVHSVLVDEDFLTEDTPATFLKKITDILTEAKVSLDVPLILLRTTSSLEETQDLVRSGWMDVFMKPLDRALTLQKLNLMNPKLPLFDEEILFTMGFGKNVNLAFVYSAKSLSEFGMKIESTSSIENRKVLQVLIPGVEEALAAVTLACKKLGDDKFEIELMFVGITPGQTQNIRKLIRQEYADGKAA